MKWHIQRFWWAYIIFAATLAWPVAVWRLQRIPPVDRDTIHAVGRFVDEAYLREYGPPAVDELLAAEMDTKIQAAPGMGLTDPSIVRVGGVLTWAPVLEPDFQAIDRNYGAGIRTAAAAGQGRAFYVTFGQILEESRAVKAMTPNFMSIQRRAKLHRAFAGRALWNGEWERALEELERAAHTGDPYHSAALIGHLIATATRSIAYRGYLELLSANPPLEVKRRALETLIELRASDPRLTELTLWGERKYLIEQFMAAGTGRQPELTVALFQAAPAAAEYSSMFQNPALRSRGEKYAAGPRASFTLLPARLRLTTIAAVVKWLRTAAEQEPALFENFIKPPEERANLDAWTLAMIGLSNSAGYSHEAHTRTRVTATAGRLAEAAFAASIYFDEHGAWPESMEDLIPAYMPPVEDEDFESEASPALRSPIGAPHGPYPPLQIAWLEMDDELRAALWHQHFWFMPADGIATTRTQAEWRERPTIPLSIAQAMNRHPRLSARASVRVSPPNALPDAEEPLDLIPLTEDYARAVTDESDRILMLRSGGGSAHPMTDDEGTSQTVRSGAPEHYIPSTPQPRDVWFSADLTAPDRALVIWSPGPDGQDDGGRSAYRPEKGTFSAGDLLVFPERF